MSDDLDRTRSWRLRKLRRRCRRPRRRETQLTPQAPIPLTGVCHGQHLVDFRESMRLFRRAGATELALFMDWRTAEEAVDSGRRPDPIKRCLQAIEAGFEVVLRLELHGQPLHIGDRPPLDDLFSTDAGFPLDLKTVPDAQLLDTNRLKTAQLNFGNPVLTHRVAEYLEKLDPWLDEIDRDRSFVALAVSEQNEVKYGMRGYHVRGANPSIMQPLGLGRKRVQKFVERQRLPGPFVERPGFSAFQQYRTGALAGFCEAVYRQLKERRFRVVSYFGRFLGPHDFIFGAPVVNEANRFSDRVVCDHNFYNGDRLVFDKEKLSTMTSYLRNTLDIEPVAGIYVEHTHVGRGRNAQMAPERLAGTLECVEYLFRNDPPAAFEIGGFRDYFPLFGQVIERMHAGIEHMASHTPQRQAYILAANETFDFFINEKDHNHEHRLEKALNFTYSLVADELGWQPRVISASKLVDSAFIDDPDALIILPMQFSLSDAALNRLATARCKVFADMRPGQITPDGVDRNGEHLQAFGISQTQWIDSATLGDSPFAFANDYVDPLFKRAASVTAPGFRFSHSTGPESGLGASSSTFFHAGLPLFLADDDAPAVASMIREFAAKSQS